MRAMLIHLSSLARICLAITFVQIFLTSGPLRAEDAVDTALVMAVDISQSVDENRYRLQMEGIAQALEDASIIRVITSGPRKSILFTLIGWADRAKVLLPWTWIGSASDAAAVAKMLRSLPNASGEYTCLGRMLRYLTDITLNPVPVRADRIIVDVSGDGPDNCNSVQDVLQHRDRLVKDGVIINGLPILEDGTESEIERWNRAPGSTQQEFPLPSKDDARTLTQWYERYVMGGHGSFVITAQGYDDFARAIRRKFIQEIAWAGTKPTTALPDNANNATFTHSIAVPRVTR